MSRTTRLALLVTLLTAQGCVTLRTPVFLRPPAAREWVGVLPLARAQIERGEYPGADTLLASFIRRHPSAREATDAAFWLGIARMDPRNQNGSVAAALESFEIHLSDADASHRAEAAALRRTAARIDSLQQDLASIAEAVRRVPTRTVEARPAAEPSPSTEDEVRRLRAELGRANEELERIRRRLTAPRP